MINPGSVGVPLDGVFAASYALLEGTSEGWQAQLQRIPFDYDALLAEFERQRWVERYGVVGRLAVKELETAHPLIYPFLVWRKSHHEDAEITWQLLEAFEREDPNDYTTSAYLARSMQTF